MAPSVVHPKKVDFEGTIEEDATSVENNGKTYEVRMDVRNFTPEEITITISDTLIQIKGLHDTEEESWESSEEVVIPPGVRSSEIDCSINGNGVLRIQAPVQAKAQTPAVKSETNTKEVKTAESTKITSQSTTTNTEREDVTVETDENINADTIAKHEDVSKDITQSQDKFEVKLNVSEFRTEEIRIKTSKKVVIVTAVKQTKTTSTKDIQKRFNIPDGVDPKSITGKVDNQTGTLTISGKISKTTKTTTTTTQETTKTNTVDQQKGTRIRTIHTPQKDLIDDSNDVQCNKEVFPTETGKNFKINLKVPASYAPENLKIRIYKNTIVITGRKETETTVRVFHKSIPVSVTVSPQEPAPVGTLSQDGVLTVIVRTSETTTVRTQAVEQRVTKTETNTTEETVSKVQPEVSNEILEVDPSAEKVTTVALEEGKKFNVEVNVSSYRKEEIHVKIYRNVVTIRAKQERREESKVTGQEFYKIVSLPQGQNPADLECTITKGVLRITSTTTTTKTTKTSKDVVQSQQKNQTNSGQSKSLVKMESGPVQTAENFERTLDASGYKPEEISVKIEDNWVVVRGKQEMCAENNFRSKEFTKKFSLPQGLKLEDIATSFTPDGIFTVFRRR